MNSRRWPEVTFWRLVFLVLAATESVVGVLRFTRGLGATTNLSDQFPWGLWIGFDVLCGVGLAAGGFAITAAVHIFNLERPRRMVRAISVPLVIVGVIQSTLHQSSLGSLYLIVPEKLHPLWYSPLLPVFFFVSAIAAGLAMVIVESALCQRAFNHHLKMDLLEPLGRAMVVVLSVYGILRVQDLARRGALFGLRRPGYEGSMFLLEMGLGVLLPIILLAIPRVRARQPGLVTGAFLAILGFVMHRLNVSVTGMERAAGVAYFPSWMEIALSLALVAAGFAMFGLAVRYLPIFPEAPHRASGVEAPAWLLARPASMVAGGSPEPLGQPSAPAGME